MTESSLRTFYWQKTSVYGKDKVCAVNMKTEGEVVKRGVELKQF